MKRRPPDTKDKLGPQHPLAAHHSHLQNWFPVDHCYQGNERRSRKIGVARGCSTFAEHFGHHQLNLLADSEEAGAVPTREHLDQVVLNGRQTDLRWTATVQAYTRKVL